MSLLALALKSQEVPHGGYVGLGGIVVGETRNTFTLISEGQTKNVIKESSRFQLQV